LLPEREEREVMRDEIERERERVEDGELVKASLNVG